MIGLRQSALFSRCTCASTQNMSSSLVSLILVGVPWGASFSPVEGVYINTAGEGLGGRGPEVLHPLFVFLHFLKHAEAQSNMISIDALTAFNGCIWHDVQKFPPALVNAGRVIPAMACKKKKKKTTRGGRAIFCRIVFPPLLNIFHEVTQAGRKPGSKPESEQARKEGSKRGFFVMPCQIHPVTCVCHAGCDPACAVLTKRGGFCLCLF